MKKNHQYRILVVDDSSTNIVLLEAILNGQGYIIDTAQSVREAYQVIKRETPDLILLDLLMPRISGFDFLKELKGNQATKEIPVIIISAVSDPENKKKSVELGALDFINKPIDIQSFIDKINTILNKKETVS
ncbi:MAG: response regulator [Bacteroidota bacterium]|nr:response regulator [Bacteroidota bacterium]